jgi:hypothetical protein
MAEFNFYQTAVLMGAIKELHPVYTFMLDRYFGGADSAAVFPTEEVYIDYDDGEGDILAPFVLPMVGAVPMMREGFQTHKLTPPYISIKRPVTSGDITHRMAGEEITSTQTPESRARTLEMADLESLKKAIVRRMEWMAVQTMLDNKCTMTHVGDNGKKGKDLTAQYYEGTDNPGTFTATKPWAAGTAEKPGSWLDGVSEQVDSMISAGREVTDLVVGSEVAKMIATDPWIKELMDNRRIEIGEIDPRWQQAGVRRLGRLNVAGTELTVFNYTGTYQEKDNKGKKTTVNYFPTKAAVLAAPNTGKVAVGAVTQVEEDKEFHTRTGVYVPKTLVSEEANTRSNIMTSRPILYPAMKSPWRACRNVLG